MLRLFPSSRSTAHQSPRLFRRPTIKSVRSGIYNIAQLISATPRGPVAANRLSTPPPDQLEHDPLINSSAKHGMRLIVRLIALYDHYAVLYAAKCDDDGYPTHARSRRPIRTYHRKPTPPSHITMLRGRISRSALSIVHFARRADAYPQEVLVSWPISPSARALLFPSYNTLELADPLWTTLIRTQNLLLNEHCSTCSCPFSLSSPRSGSQCWLLAFHSTGRRRRSGASCLSADRSYMRDYRLPE